MERKLGEIFTCDGKTYLIVPREKEDCCIGCAFDLGEYACKKPRNESRNNFGHCYFRFREDKKGIIFKEIKDMERKVGEVFQYEGKTYQVVEGIRCDGCAFNRDAKCSTIREPLGSCDSIIRKDSINVVFKEINNMEIKNNQLTIDIPEGMEIDLENSNLAKGIVKFKKKYITYDDILQSYATDFGGIRVPNHCIDKILAISQLMNIAKYYNRDWKPDWRSLMESKYYIYYSTRSNTYGVANTSNTNYGNIYFRSYKDAQEVIDNPNFRDILDVVYKN